MGKRFLLLAMFVGVLGGSAHADTVGLTSFTGGNAYESVDGSDNVIGWQFTANSNITVTALGLYNASSYGYALSGTYEVGLWNAGGTLLAEANVGNSAPAQIDSFYFVPVSPVALSAGGVYTLGVLDQADLGYISSTSARTTSPGITYNNGVYTDSTVLADPGTNGVTYDGRFGPNLEYATVSTTPEPSSLILLGTGLTGLFGAARRRYKKS